MREEASRAWREVDLNALAHNARTLQAALCSGCRLMAVVKAEELGPFIVYFIATKIQIYPLFL